METKRFRLGIDIGSISLNTVILDHNNAIVENHYDYCHGQPFVVLKNRLGDLLTRFSENEIEVLAITGTGGRLAVELIGGRFVNEIVAQSNAVAHFYPDVKSVIEMGGEDSKLLFMEKDEVSGSSRLVDFSMNSLCAAGTGSFLDQQAKRIGISIEKEFGELALKSEKPPRIAGRCSVFAKSDMIHLQQIATPVQDIVAGLCYAVARNFKSNLAKGKELKRPILFQGGVAANAGVVRAFKEILNVTDNEFIIPTYYASMGAIGAVLQDTDKSFTNSHFIGLEKLNKYLESDKSNSKHLEKLTESGAIYNTQEYPFDDEAKPLPVYLGIDVGSLSTNVVLIDEHNHVIARRYLPTASRPLEAIQKGLTEIYEELGNRVVVMAAGTTGSGRYLTGDFIGADIIKNEITAQATAAIAYDHTVDTIFEIGGQDSKYISIKNGVVVDFEMNKVCAAGTGSFLEEQAEKLKINIKEEFGQLALNSKKPTALGDRCTVFMESDLNAHQQKGEKTENLVAGLAYSIVYNYLQKVVGDKHVGNKIFFQGGVTNNKGVVAAFEKVTGKQITIPPHFDVTGAIGVAMIARDKLINGEKTRFKGFDVRNVPYTVDKFVCKACTNHCEIRTVKINGEKKPLFYGGRCERYEMEDRKNKGKDIPNLFEERVNYLLENYQEDVNKGQLSIGIPRALMVFYQQFPFWRSFFQHLGFQVILSKESDRELISESLEMLSAETCFPIELVHGHVNDLLKKQVDYLFVPFIVNTKPKVSNRSSNCNCPWIQSYPFMIRAALKDKNIEDSLLTPTLHFLYHDRALVKELSEFFNKKFNIQKSKIKQAINQGLIEQDKFEKRIVLRGEEVLKNLPKDKECLVILGRPYNTGDPHLNLRMIEKLINLDVFPIPLDYLPLHKENVFEDYDSMYWPNGQKILAASKIIAKDERLHAVYLSNFRCGPDSFITHYVREELKGKPYANIEIDEHSADAGLITRFEAFLDSLKSSRKIKSSCETIIRPGKMSAELMTDRVLYFPYMNDASYMIAAAARACGVESYSLPMQTNEELALARKYLSSRECFPMICTTGSFLKKLQEPGIDPAKVSFFMPDHNGPCRFGQYNRLQKIIFDRLGYKNVKITSPSNDSSYEDIVGKNGRKFRFLSWKGFVAIDLLRKLLQERRPYELITGMTDKVYQKGLKSLEECIENGGNGLKQVLRQAALEFNSIPFKNGTRKPVIAVLGEIFMRDNSFCNGFVIKKLEALGAETLVSPFSEWLTYSTYRYARDSKWKGNTTGLIKAHIQKFGQQLTHRQLLKSVSDLIDLEKEVEVEEMLRLCNPYVHKDYDGDPPLAMGTAVALADREISGICNILPFTCMPATILTAVSNTFRKDHNKLPWVDVAYDGQEAASLQTQLESFMHQAHEYSRINKFDQPENWVLKKIEDRNNHYPVSTPF